MAPFRLFSESPKISHRNLPNSRIAVTRLYGTCDSRKQGPGSLRSFTSKPHHPQRLIIPSASLQHSIYMATAVAANSARINHRVNRVRERHTDALANECVEHVTLKRHMSFVGNPIDVLRRSKSGRVRPNVIEDENMDPDRWSAPTGASTSFRDTAEEGVRRAKAASPAMRSAFWEWWVIDPRHSMRLGTWDLITVFALVFV